MVIRDVGAAPAHFRRGTSRRGEESKEICAAQSKH
jgi:hypothetical protein